MAKEQNQELLMPSAAAKQLGISVTTLRKYSLLAEKVTQDNNHYHRTKQNSRLYSADDIADLKRVHQIAKEKSVTLEEATAEVFGASLTQGLAINEQAGDLVDMQQFAQFVNALEQTIMQQNQAINALKEQLDTISEQNQELLRLQKQQPASQAELTEEQIEQLPDISGVVEPVSAAPAAPEQAVKAAAEKKQTAEDVHAEILRKARENAEKKSSENLHRTLADMQIPQKTHWWERFLS